MTKLPKNTGNTNALKSDVMASAQIQMRVTPDRKNRYILQAQREGLKLSEWIQKHIDAVCDAAGTPVTTRNTTD